MTSNSELHVIFGIGPLGSAVMRELVAHGKRVHMVNRSGHGSLPEGVELYGGDASDLSFTREVCKGASVVYNCANPPYPKWAELFPPLQDGIIEGAAAAGAKLVSAENLYMYGAVGGPITEDLPYAATSRTGRTRARMAEALLAAHESGKVRATIGRASDFTGRVYIWRPPETGCSTRHWRAKAPSGSPTSICSTRKRLSRTSVGRWWR